MRFSVVIPVFNDSERLNKCLNALMQQEHLPYEIIVVDNGSDDKTKLQKLCNSFALVKLTEEHQVGSYAARNKAISLVSGDVIAFTDSDCVPDKRWLAAASELFAQRGVDVVAGEIQVFYKNTDKPTCVELYESEFAFQQAANVKNGHCVTANLLVKRSLIEEIGDFSTTSVSGGDVEFSKRLVQHGVPLHFGAEAVVAHPARHSMGEFSSKIKRVFTGAYCLRNESEYMATQFTAMGMLKALKPPLIGMVNVIKKRRCSREGFIIALMMLVHRYYAFWVKFSCLLFGPDKRVR